MILNLVYQLRGMFESDTYRNTLGLDFNLGIRQIPIDIAGRVSCSQNHRTTKLFIECQTANYSIAIQNKTGHFRLEMYLTTATENGVTHSLNDTRQLIGADMWMGIGKEDFLYKDNAEFRKLLDKNRLRYTYHESGAGHEWANWRDYLVIFTQQLFK